MSKTHGITHGKCKTTKNKQNNTTNINDQERDCITTVNVQNTKLLR